MHGERVELRAQLPEAVGALRLALEVGQLEHEHRKRGARRVEQVENGQKDLLPTAVLDVEHDLLTH